MANAPYVHMLRRLLLGLLKGGVLGALLGGALVFGVGMATLQGGLGYAAIVLASVLVALIAGRPIWEKGAWVEVLLKSIVAALAGAGLFYLITRYLTPSQLATGEIALVQRPLLVLPTIATLLAMLFEADNSDDAEPPDPKQPKPRVAIEAPQPQATAFDEADLAEDSESSAAKRARS